MSDLTAPRPRLRVGAFQFAGGPDVGANLDALEQGIAQAGAAGVRLLLTQECALSGYPPVETERIAGIDFDAVDRATAHVQALAARHDLYVALGTIVPEQGSFLNALVLIGPRGEEVGRYAKRALAGWDSENFSPGDTEGVFSVDDVKVGLRICYEVRFPEYFRELFAADAQLALVAFCDTAEAPSPTRRALIEGHLATRAVENALTVVSANSHARHQTAPTAILGPDGERLALAPGDRAALIMHDWQLTEPSRWQRSRIEHSRELLRRRQSPRLHDG